MSTDLKELKKVLEVQSRQKLHKDIKYKFLPSLGLKDIIQGFRNPKNKDFIGVLHFKWKSDENGQYDYHSIWYDTEEDAIEVLEKQNYKCTLTGIELTFKPIMTASIDRIENEKGYTKENIQWVHKHINIMKHRYAQEYFINMCHMVSKHQN